ncbi:MAG TPA: hypothetical protein VK369_15995 [Segetibacter sp.]|nr:hypothetical protein [Segetibacter sp.]
MPFIKKQYTVLKKYDFNEFGGLLTHTLVNFEKGTLTKETWENLIFKLKDP